MTRPAGAPAETSLLTTAKDAGLICLLGMSYRYDYTCGHPGVLVWTVLGPTATMVLAYVVLAAVPRASRVRLLTGLAFALGEVLMSRRQPVPPVGADLLLLLFRDFWLALMVATFAAVCVGLYLFLTERDEDPKEPPHSSGGRRVRPSSA